MQLGGGKEALVKEYQCTGKDTNLNLVDNTVKRVPLVRIKVDRPYLCGETEDRWVYLIQCMIS